MDAGELKRWLASVARLTPAQKADLLKFFAQMARQRWRRPPRKWACTTKP